MGLHYTAAPVLVFAVLALIALFLRWAFGTGGARRPAAPGDDGLLVRVATTTSHESALALRAVLSDAGVRSTVRLAAAHRAEVLVFREDAERARALAATFRS
ncbi:hypothetical protein [Trujillonella endophytica]|uniref:DUF2007 domain-containing protein n=1 Tax=Trujillonella endophytica TaxID=673521 RepID=A0A1H8TKR4_9ACTN|nr:hypothetical protein [Trujillella endophytica]SEO91173.1 hypothetical protein SAMN05660991_02330 [Trujillella endophytica]